MVEPAIGVIGDTRHRRALVLGGGIAFAAALVLASLSTTAAALLVAFCVLDPSSGAFVSLSQATVMDAEPAEREANMTRWTVAGSIGAIAGPGLVAAAVWLDLGWRAAFAACAAAAVALVVAARRVRFVPPDAARARSALAAALAALRRRDVLRWLALLEIADLLLDVFLGFLALYFVDEVHGGAQAGTAAVATWTAAGMAGGLLVLRVLRRVDGLAYVRASAAAAVVLFAAFLLVPGIVPKLALLAALAIANAGWYPVLKARLYAALPGQSGTVMSLGHVFGLPAALLPLALGLVADAWGLEIALWLLLTAPLALLALVPRERNF